VAPREHQSVDRTPEGAALPVRGLKIIALSVFAGIAAAPFAFVAAGLLGLSKVIASVAAGVAMAALVGLILSSEGRRAT
jgi:hypothetical protein